MCQNSWSGKLLIYNQSCFIICEIIPINNIFIINIFEVVLMKLFIIVLSERDLLDFDHRYLIQELKKATDSNRATLYQHEKFLQERKMMEQKMEDVLKELKERENLITDLKKALDDRENNSMHDQLVTDVEAYASKADELFRANFDKSCIIITLQSQLLAAKESFEEFRKSNESLRRKNENLVGQVRDLTISYDFQRSQSKRLSKQVDANNTELKQVADTKKELLALRFELARVREENEVLMHKTGELDKRNNELETLCELLHQEKSCAEQARGKVNNLNE
jgi:hypothetical protein